MKRHRVTLLLAILVISAALLIRGLRIPFWRDEQGIRAYVVDKIPIGTPIAESRARIRSRGWQIESEWAQPDPMPMYGTEKGVRVVHAELGSYWLGFRTDFDAFFGFDSRGNLVEVRVRKMVDAP